MSNVVDINGKEIDGRDDIFNQGVTVGQVKSWMNRTLEVLAEAEKLDNAHPIMLLGCVFFTVNAAWDKDGNFLGYEAYIGFDCKFHELYGETLGLPVTNKCIPLKTSRGPIRVFKTLDAAAGSGGDMGFYEMQVDLIE